MEEQQITSTNNEDKYASRTRNMAPNNASEEVQTIAQELAQARTLIQSLMIENQTLRSNIHNASVESSFGGTVCKPTTEMASWESFQPISTPINAPNPHYKDSARALLKSPGIFRGHKDALRSWLIKLADKFDEDINTFRTEKSRMMYLMSYLQEDAETYIRMRYRSNERPFSGVAEMVQTLETHYGHHFNEYRRKHHLRQRSRGDTR